jgi:hypothetical protein
LVAGEPSPLPESQRDVLNIPASLFDEEQDGFGNLVVDNPDGDFILSGSLALPAGGSLAVKAKNVRVSGSIVARGGDVSLKAYNYSPLLYNEQAVNGVFDFPPTPGVQANRGDIAVAQGSKIDVSGMMVDERLTAPSPAFRGRVLHGGSVLLEGYNVRLATGSLVDASGGAYASPRGSYTYGDAGSIALLSGKDPDLATSVGGELLLGGSLQAYSVKRGGSLRLQSNFIQVGGSSAPAKGILLKPEFFQQGGFADYTLVGLGGRSAEDAFIPAVRITAGTVVRPMAQSWLHEVYAQELPGLRRGIEDYVLAQGGASVPRSHQEQISRGIRSMGSDFFRPLLEQEGVRSAASLSLVGLGFNDKFTGNSPTDLLLEGLGLIDMEPGSRIITDAGASVSMKGDVVIVDGTVIAPGGKIDIRGGNSFRLTDGNSPIALPTVLIGSAADLSAKGTVVYLPDLFGRRSGVLYPGGSINISGNILAEKGALVDVSGTSATLDFHPSRLGPAYASVPSNAGLTTTPWGRRSVSIKLASDGGRISLSGSQLLFSDASLRGAAGGDGALGGTLAVSSGNYYLSGESRSGADINMIVQPSGSVVEAAGAAGEGDRLRQLLAGPKPEDAVASLVGAGRIQRGIGLFALDQFGQGGFDNLDLGYYYNAAASPIPFGGNLKFTGPSAINARGYLRLAGGGVIQSDSLLSLRAPYVAIGQAFRQPLNPSETFQPFRSFDGATGSTPQAFVPPSAGDGMLDVAASLIDIGYISLQGIGRASLSAPGGDIRGSGTFNMSGDLTLQASQIYPVTLADFNLFAYDNSITGAAGSVTIKSAGTSIAPLSAGGHLGIFASSIIQGGTLRAPLGSITLGWNGHGEQPVNRVVGAERSVPVAAQVTLSSGSLTSVSADGQTIPFGLSPDGVSWIDPRGVDVTVSGLPERGVAISAENVTTAAGSLIDLQGGGDLLAYHWVSGIGGSADLLGSAEQVWSAGNDYNAGDLVLSAGSTWSARLDLDHTAFAVTPQPEAGSFYWSRVADSYAILPGFRGRFAPWNEFNTSIYSGALSGDPGYTAAGLHLGQQVSLPSLPGFGGGSYTLLPRRYALLPGALLVVPDEGHLVDSSSVISTEAPSLRSGIQSGSMVPLPGGAYLVSGQPWNSFNPAGQGSLVQGRFEVVPPSVLAARASYDRYSANSFLSAAANRLGLVQAQQLPADAARLGVEGARGLSLAGSVSARGAGFGRAADIDLSSLSEIHLLGAGASAPAQAAAVLDLTTLRGWDAGSLLIGGLRGESDAKGTYVDVRSPKINLDGRATRLEFSDVTLVAKQEVSVQSGSSIVASGSMNGNAATLQLKGDGAALRVSADPAAMLTRSDLGGGSDAQLKVGAQAYLAGGSVVLDSSSAMEIAPSATVDASSLSISSGQISLLLEPQTLPLAGEEVSGQLVLEGNVLARAAQSDLLRLSSYRTIDLYGSGTFGDASLARLELLGGGLRGYGANGGIASVAAGSLLLANPLNVSPQARSGSAGDLQLQVGQIELGANSFDLSGYQSISGEISGGILAVSDGALSTSASLSLTLPLLTGAQGVSYQIQSDGQLKLLSSATATILSPGIGSRFDLVADSLKVSAPILLPSGSLSMTARKGDIEVDGVLSVAGAARQFFDVTKYADAGRIDLTASHGLVSLSAGSSVSIAADSRGGDAGVLTIKSPTGLFELLGKISAGAGLNGTGGSFDLDAGSLANFDLLMKDLDAAGAFTRRDLRVRRGDVAVSGSVRAREFFLSTDGGNIDVFGKIDASGPTGGQIALNSSGNLTLHSGSVLNVAADDFSNAGKGGHISLAAGSAVQGVANESAVLDLQSGSKIDLSVASIVPGGYQEPGSSAFYGRFEGTLSLRAPRTVDGIRLNQIGSEITGGSSILAEAFRVYQPAGGLLNISTRDEMNGDNMAFMDAYEASIRSGLLGSDNLGLGPLLVLAPGVEMVNTSGDLVLGLANKTGSTNPEALSDADWDLSGFRYGARQAPGVLTLRASGDLVFNNALSDGFTPIEKNTATTYADNGHSLMWLAPLQSLSENLPVNLQSWSYNLAAGADLSAADPLQVLAVDSLASDKGSVLVGEFFSSAVPNTSSTGAAAGIGPLGQTVDTIRINTANNNADRGTRFEVIRTGTGSIDVGAGRDIQLRNPFATIYTAGVGFPDRNSVFEADDFSLPVTAPRKDPDQGTLGAAQQKYEAYYSIAGGDLRLSAGSDIGRYSIDSNKKVVVDASRQLPTHWLYRRGLIDGDTGLFASIVSTGLQPNFTDPSASTTWWVDYSNFFAGFGALGGGDIKMRAGRDLINADAAIPTSARMAGIDPTTGLNLAPSEMKLQETGGGNLTVEAGRNVDGGNYYVEKGNGSLFARDEVTSNEARSISPGALSGAGPFDPLTWQAVSLFGGRVSFDVAARSDVLLGPATSAFMLPQGLNNKFWYKTLFDTMGSGSSLDVASFGGAVTHRLAVTLPDSSSAPTALSAIYRQGGAGSKFSTGYYRPWLRWSEGKTDNLQALGSVSFPTLRSTAFGGDVSVVGQLNLFPSASGTLELLASGAIPGLGASGVTTAGGSTVVAWTAARLNLSDANPFSYPGIASPFGIQQAAGVTSFLSLLVTSANLYQQASALFAETGSYSGPSSLIDVKSALHAPTPLHAGDQSPVRLYAGQGDLADLTLFSSKKAAIYAQRDISDVAFYLQHTSEADISYIAAGRDIILFNENAAGRVVADNLAAGNVIVDAANPTTVAGSGGVPVSTKALAGDISLGGGGVLQVLAGRDLDLGSGANFADGTGFGLTTIGRARNPYLPFAGAAIVAMAGVASQDGPALSLTRSTLTFSSSDEHEALRELDELFVSLVKEGVQAATSGDYSGAYAAVEKIFPANLANAGNLYTRARDIRTSSGGSITLGTPGGGLTMASDIFGNPATPPGIVTEYGGKVSVLAKKSIEIGRARIFTLRGGDLTVWSAEGDIAAGTSPKTVVTAPPTRVVFDPNSAAVQTDLGGLVTGGGLGVLASVAGVKPGAVTLLAPLGTVDAGDAGIRATGDIVIAAAKVLNADNIAAGGKSVGVPAPPPVVAPNVGGLTAASSSSAATSTVASSLAQKSQQQPSAEEAPPSVIAVEVLGYGGSELPREINTGGNRQGGGQATLGLL